MATLKTPCAVFTELYIACQWAAGYLDDFPELVVVELGPGLGSAVESEPGGKLLDVDGFPSNVYKAPADLSELEKCAECGKTAADDYRPLATKYDESETV